MFLQEKINRILNIVAAISRRDLLIWSSYRFAACFQVIMIVIFVGLLHFISAATSKNQVYIQIIKEKYGIDYFAFLLTGMAVSHYFIFALQSFARFLRREQLRGTFEALMAAAANPSEVILALSLWHFFVNTVIVLVYFACGMIFFGISLSGANVLTAAVVFLLTFICFAGLGIVSASFIVCFKEGDPINFLIGAGLSVFGGAFFPVEIIKGSFQLISVFLPTTYAFDAIRYALFKGYSVFMLQPEILALAAFSAVFFVAGVISFNAAVKRAKQNGSLSHY